jgi:hypothetical protein
MFTFIHSSKLLNTPSLNDIVGQFLTGEPDLRNSDGTKRMEKAGKQTIDIPSGVIERIAIGYKRAHGRGQSYAQEQADKLTAQGTKISQGTLLKRIHDFNRGKTYRSLL